MSACVLTRVRAYSCCSSCLRELVVCNALMYLQYGINETERSISRSEQMGHCVPTRSFFLSVKIVDCVVIRTQKWPSEIRNCAVCVCLGDDYDN